MKLDLKVGDYVRTKKGIAKIVDRILDPNNYYFKMWVTDTFLELNYDTEYVCEEDVIKASDKLVDLIEENDYIRIISSPKFEYVYYSYGKLVIRNDIDISNYSDNFIAEVLTHEQIEQMSYKVGE